MVGDTYSIFTTSLAVLLAAVFLYGPKKAIFRIATMMQDGVSRAMLGEEKVASVQTFYNLVDKNMAGEQVSMSSFKGEVLLFVNIASK